MNSAPLRCTEYTRIAGWMSAFVTTATFWFLHDAYDRLPLLVPIQFEGGNPSLFAFKSVELVYLPFGLQVALSLVFAAIVGVLIRRSSGPDDRGLADGPTRHAAEAIALLAMVWIAFQGVNAWRLVSLYSRTYDSDLEFYALAIITAVTATITIAARAVLQARELDHEGGESFTLEPSRPLARAVLAALVGVGIAVPVYLVAAVWEGLRHI